MIQTIAESLCSLLDTLAPVLNLVVLVIGGLGGGLIATLLQCKQIRKLKAEIRKLEKEEIKLVGDNLERLQKARSFYIEALSNCSKASNELIELLNHEAPIPEVKLQRENLCSILTEQMIPGYLSYIEWEVLDRKNDTDSLIGFIEKHIIPELQRVANWIGIINLPVLVVKVGGFEPLVILERNMEPFLKFTLSIPKGRRNEINKDLASAIREITGTKS